jgi:hypothetical protein
MLCPITLLFDENLIDYFLPVIHSAIEHLQCDYHICILTNTEDNVNKIKQLLEQYYTPNQFTVKFVSTDDMILLNDLYYVEHRKDISGFIYSQLLLSDYFSNFKKLLVLECDQIVKKDLTAFWSECFEKDIKIGAVKSNTGPLTLATLAKEYPNEIPETFNAGVMVIDTEWWRENQCTQKCFNECIKQINEKGNRYDFYQEGVMNLVFKGQFTVLDPIYNCIGLGHDTNMDQTLLDNAAILHWNGLRKPWSIYGYYTEYWTKYV